MARILLVLPTGTYRADDFLAAADALGAEVVVASDRRQAMAEAMGDRALVVDLCDPEGAAAVVAALAERSPLDAVVAVDDSGVELAAAAAGRLGLAHNQAGAVAVTRDKARMRRALAAAGVAQPDFAVLGPGDDPAAVASAVGFPAVVKPVALSASRGVIRVDDAESAGAAAARIRAILAAAGEDPEGPLVVDSFVPGPEVAVEGLLRDGRLEVLAVFDKPDPLDGPFFEETIYVTPSRLGPADLEALGGLVAGAVAAIGLTEGPIHAEARMAPGGPRLLEVAARSIGGLCSRALRFGAGVSLEELILRHALGAPLPDLQREAAASGVMMIPIPVSGTLRGVGGVDAARQVAGVADVVITVNPGRRVVSLPEGDRYLGFVFARGSSPAEVEASLRTAHAALEVRIEPAA
ncbi:MAG TPA: ATP-grasp domain-containing protein [Acidimicrobiales bacterium]|nr:ATP-grasp domain-containing protein [Acidimicrobiales bacterium]